VEYKVEVLEKAVKTYGYVHQTIKAAEELSELLVALNKWLGMSENEDYIRDNIREECADVEIMLGQLKIIFGDWSGWTHDKMDTLEDRINAINGTKENDR
jgi:hypothetical protein